MSTFWIIYLVALFIVGSSLAIIAWTDRHDYERLTWVHILCCATLAVTPILNLVVLVVATSHVVLHTLHRRDEARRLDPKYAKTIPDTVALLDSYTCECMGIKADPRFPDQTSKPDSEI